MKWLLFLSAFVGLSAQAQAQYQVTRIQPQDCSLTQQTSMGYSLKDCNQAILRASRSQNGHSLQLSGGDHIVIQKNNLGSNLVVNSGKRNNTALYMPLGIKDGQTQVSGPIDIIAKKNLIGRRVPQAIIYRLNYQRDDGSKGFQVVTIKLEQGLSGLKKACTQAVYDSNNSSVFKQKTELAKEKAMRQYAADYAQQKSFKKDSCMLYQEQHQTDNSPIDPYEGDYMETSI